jgi:hypothetical protein
MNLTSSTSIPQRDGLGEVANPNSLILPWFSCAQNLELPKGCQPPVITLALKVTYHQGGGFMSGKGSGQLIINAREDRLENF